jgi:hypothetical protein
MEDVRIVPSDHVYEIPVQRSARATVKRLEGYARNQS